MRLEHRLLAISLTFGSTLLVATIAQDPPKANPPVDTKPDKLPDGIQIENRGPVHEAFANPGAQHAVALRVRPHPRPRHLLFLKSLPMKSQQGRTSPGFRVIGSSIPKRKTSSGYPAFTAMHLRDEHGRQANGKWKTDSIAISPATGN